jgi:general secretion pathway protein G
MKNGERGFTLVEMMVVVVIIGIVATVVAVNVVDRLERAKVRLTVAAIARLKGEVQLFKLDQDRYPEQLQDLAHQPVYVDPRKWPESNYLDEVPPDGWDRPFHYACPGTRGPYDIVSWGADGKPGGEGVNADLWSHPAR